MVDFVPRVVDVSHYEVIADDGWQRAKNAGIVGMIAKCTQGLHYVDPNYDDMIRNAISFGILPGAYHFNTGEDPVAQADKFLSVVNPGNDAGGFETVLLALDYEKNPRSDMTIQQAVAFLKRCEQVVGRKIVIYSGDKLKETIGDLNDDDKAYVGSHKLWIAEYGPNVRLPDGFDTWWLHQYTGDGFGPDPHWIDGITCPGNKGLDLNRYNDVNGDHLIGEWIT